MTYMLLDTGYVLREADGAMIPADPGNRDYQEYLAWKDAGGIVTPAPMPNLFDVAAAARYDAEVSGIVLNGSVILTDRDSQGLINGAVALVQINPGAVVRFKTAAATFVTLNAQQVIGIGVAVGAHVQACFAREADVAAEVAAGILTTPEGVRLRFSDLTRS